MYSPKVLADSKLFDEAPNERTPYSCAEEHSET